MNSKVAEMVTALATGNASAVDTAFTAVMSEKMNAALDERKIAVASQIYNTESVENSVEESVLDKNLSAELDSVANGADMVTHKGIDYHRRGPTDSTKQPGKWKNSAQTKADAIHQANLKHWSKKK